VSCKKPRFLLLIHSPNRLFYESELSHLHTRGPSVSFRVKRLNMPGTRNQPGLHMRVGGLGGDMSQQRHIPGREQKKDYVPVLICRTRTPRISSQ
jgi:hypothetical protein